MAQRPRVVELSRGYLGSHVAGMHRGRILLVLRRGEVVPKLLLGTALRITRYDATAIDHPNPKVPRKATQDEVWRSVASCCGRGPDDLQGERVSLQAVSGTAIHPLIAGLKRKIVGIFSRRKCSQTKNCKQSPRH